jgi:hypothetical protein
VVVARNLKKPHVRRIITRWLQIARSSLLHGVKNKPFVYDDFDLVNRTKHNQTK